MEIKTMSISRRKFAQLLGAGAAGTLATISRSPAAEPVASAPARPSATAGVVRLSSNENPYGPSQKALKAMDDAFSLAWRYPDEHADLLIDSLAKLNGVGRDQILLGDGSGEILKLCAEVFTGPIARDRVRTDATRPGVDAAQRHTQERGDLADAKEGRAGRVRHRQRPSWVVPVPSGSGPIPARRKRPWRT